MDYKGYEEKLTTKEKPLDLLSTCFCDICRAKASIIDAFLFCVVLLNRLCELVYVRIKFCVVLLNLVCACIRKN